MSPLKGYKGTYYEGGIRVPFLLTGQKSWQPKSLFNSNYRRRHISNLQEIITGKNKIDPKIDGGIVPLLKGKKIEPRNIYWHFLAIYKVIHKDKINKEIRSLGLDHVVSSEVANGNSSNTLKTKTLNCLI